MVVSEILFFAESGGDQLFDFRESVIGALTGDLDDELRALLGGQHDNAHDALGVDALMVLGDGNLASIVAAGQLDQAGCGAKMQTQFVLDLDRGPAGRESLGPVLRRIQYCNP